MAIALHEASSGNVNLFIWDWKSLAYGFLDPPIENEVLSSTGLEEMLASYFDGQTSNQEIQFIGHSMGGKVSMLAADGIDGIGEVDVVQVTLLDPYNAADIVNDQSHSFFVDHYCSIASRIISDVSIAGYNLDNCYVYGADVNVYLADVEMDNWTIIGFISEFSRCHGEAVNYYLNSINNISSDYGGYYWSKTRSNSQNQTAQYYFGYMDYNKELEETNFNTYNQKAVSDFERDFY